MIDVFVTHYTDELLWDLNPILLEQLNFMRAVGATTEYLVSVLYWCPPALDEKFDREVVALAPPDVAFHKNRRPGRPDIQPSLRNFADELARDVYVLIHNDVRVTRGWLDVLVRDFAEAEQRWGRGNCLVHPRYVPYHWLPGFEALGTKVPAWFVAHAKTLQHFRSVVDPYGFFVDGNGLLYSLGDCPLTDDGHALMMYCTRKGYFDPVGPCDESFVHFNFDDDDWGMRALLVGRKNVKSQNCLLGHYEGMSFFHPALRAALADTRQSNRQIFRAKWGDKAVAAHSDGSIWVRLHEGKGLP